jgi:hypothetical protein
MDALGIGSGCSLNEAQNYLDLIEVQLLLPSLFLSAVTERGRVCALSVCANLVGRAKEGLSKMRLRNCIKSPCVP